jgi:hypothetical protein
MLQLFAGHDASHEWIELNREAGEQARLLRVSHHHSMAAAVRRCR